MFRSLLGIIAAGAILTAPMSSGAASNPFIGTWQASAVVPGAGGMKMAVTIQIVFTPQGTYSELDRSYVGLTQETGNYLLMANNILRLVVTNWSPKQQCIPPTGCVPIRKPTGSALQYKFTSATAFLAHDVTFGNGMTLTYHRVQ